MMRKKACGIHFAGLLLVAFAAATLIGCGIKVKPERSLTPPPVVYCHDGIGHIPGSKPWILGGTCCCTPTPEMFDTYRAENTVPEDMTYDQFLQLFKDKGIITDLDLEYRGSNCRCEQGPHVVFGGHCMVTPTPGTRLYEEVTAGQRFKLK
jgi:hypothetical protein